MAKNPAARHYVSQALGYEVEVLDTPQIAGAYGAGLLARDAHRGALDIAAADDLQTEDELLAKLASGSATCAQCDGVLGHEDGHGHVKGVAGPVSVILQTRVPSPVSGR